MHAVTGRATSSPEGHAEAVTLLRRAHDLGVEHFDTAQMYGSGLANRMLHDAFDGRRGEVVIASKTGFYAQAGAPDGMAIAQQPHELRAEVEANLASLGSDWLDIVYLRRLDVPPGLVAQGDQLVPLDDQLAEMIAMRDEGKIRGIGLSNVNAEQLNQALPAGIVAVSNLYNVMDRSSEPVLDACRELDLPWVPFIPRGTWSWRPELTNAVTHPKVVDIATRLDVTPSQVTLAWQLAHAPNSCLIAGAGTIAHLEENVAAADVTLDAKSLAALDGVSND